MPCFWPAPRARRWRRRILRTIPADAKRGVMSPVQGMTVEIDGKRIELAAGAQIRDGRNMIVRADRAAARRRW